MRKELTVALLGLLATVPARSRWRWRIRPEHRTQTIRALMRFTTLPAPATWIRRAS